MKLFVVLLLLTFLLGGCEFHQMEKSKRQLKQGLSFLKEKFYENFIESDDSSIESSNEESMEWINFQDSIIDRVFTGNAPINVFSGVLLVLVGYLKVMNHLKAEKRNVSVLKASTGTSSSSLTVNNTLNYSESVTSTLVLDTEMTALADLSITETTTSAITTSFTTLSASEIQTEIPTTTPPDAPPTINLTTTSNSIQTTLSSDEALTTTETILTEYYTDEESTAKPINSNLTGNFTDKVLTAMPTNSILTEHSTDAESTIMPTISVPTENFTHETLTILTTLNLPPVAVTKTKFINLATMLPRKSYSTNQFEMKIPDEYDYSMDYDNFIDEGDWYMEPIFYPINYHMGYYRPIQSSKQKLIKSGRTPFYPFGK